MKKLWARLVEWWRSPRMKECLHCNTHVYTREHNWHCDCKPAQIIKMAREISLSFLAMVGVPFVVFITHIGGE